MCFLHSIRSPFRLWSSSRVSFLKPLLTNECNFFFFMRSRSDFFSRVLRFYSLCERAQREGWWVRLITENVAAGGVISCVKLPPVRPHRELTRWGPSSCGHVPTPLSLLPSRWDRIVSASIENRKAVSLTVEKNLPWTCQNNCWVVCYRRKHRVGKSPES